MLMAICFCFLPSRPTRGPCGNLRISSCAVKYLDKLLQLTLAAQAHDQENCRLYHYFFFLVGNLRAGGLLFL